MSRPGRVRALAALSLITPLVLLSPLAAQDTTGGFARLTPPGVEPRVFAPGVVSTGAYEFAITLTPAMDELYVTRRIDPGPNRIVLVRVADGKLQEAIPAPFSKPDGEYEASIAPDGKSIFFKQDRGIVRATRTAGGWSEPEPLGPEVNGRGAMAQWVDAAGNLYFTRAGGLVVARPRGEGYGEAESVGPHFQMPAGDAAHGFVAPDGSYIIFDSQFRKGGKGKADLWISRRNADGTWSQPSNLEALNTPGTEMCASVSPDGRFLFFSRDGDIFWVAAAVLEQYR